jgi:hypothetical protein
MALGNGLSAIGTRWHSHGTGTLRLGGGPMFDNLPHGRPNVLSVRRYDRVAGSPR